MSARRRLAVVTAAAALTLCAFAYFARRVSLISFNFAGTPEVARMLARSMEDQKRLAQLDPARRDEYRRRFDALRHVVNRFDILSMNHRAIARRYERVLVTVVAAILLAAIVFYAIALRRREQRLSAVQRAIEALSRGDERNAATGDRSGDVIGRISTMIEETSRAVVRDRRRLQYLSHLSSWQEAARRHSHEIRTPLTAAQLEIDRLVAVARSSGDADEVERLRASIYEELEQLRAFTRNFTSFAAIGQPRLERRDLYQWLDEFRSTFASAWPRLRLRIDGEPCDAQVAIDREMLRRVLVNLCNNSALAMNGHGGAVSFHVACDGDAVLLDVVDDGPGVPPEIRDRLFEPYTTTRNVGEGMGLGLAISRKIILDHGGDLELLDRAGGAAFRITLPSAAGGAS